MSTKSNDLYCDTEALENVKEKISLLHNGYVVLGSTSNSGGLKEDGNRIRNILNSLDAYDNSYDNFFDKYDLSSKANVIYNKSNKFVESWIDFSKAFSKSYKLLGDSTTTATDIMENFDSSGSNTAPRINSPYDYVSYLKKQGKYKEAASIQSLIKSGVIGASLVTKNGTKSKNNNVPDKNTGTETGNVSTVYTSPSSSSSDSTSDKTGPQHNGVIKIDEEEKEKFEEFKEKFKDQEEKLRKEQEEVEKQQKEIKNQQEALKKQQEEIKKQQDEIAKKQEELAKKDEELKKREEELNNREQQNNNTPANGPTTPNDSNNGNNNTPSDNNNYNNNNNNSAPQNTVYRQENTTPSTKGDSGSLGTGNDLFGDDPEPTTTPTTLPDADTTTKSSKSGFNPIPIAVGLGAAVAGGVGVKAYKNHKQNSEFDDTNEDSFTNGNRFWTDDEPNVVNSEQNEINSDELFNEQTTAPSYSAVTNQANNSDTWSVQDTSTSEDDSRTYDLLGEN